MENGRRTSSTVDVVQYLVVCGMKAPDVGPILEFTRLCHRKQRSVPEWNDDRFCTCRIPLGSPSTSTRMACGNQSVTTGSCTSSCCTSCSQPGWTTFTVRIVPSVAGAFGEALHLMEFQDCRPTVYLGDLQCGGLAQTSWRKSSYSGGGGTNCVEAAWNRQPPSTSSGVLVRDSKNPAAPVLTIPTTAWRQLLASGGGS
jgi:hypothetical protein